MRTDFQSLSRFAANLWRQFIPFGLFRDANFGSVEQRIANFRYNRQHREILPFFIVKWIAVAACLLAGMEMLSYLADKTMEGSGAYICMVTLCATTGIVFAFSCVAITVLMVCYLFLSRAEH